MKGDDMKSDGIEATAFIAVLIVALISVGFSSAVYWVISELIAQSIEAALSLPLVVPPN